MKKIAILSDIHGNLEALKSVAEDIARRNIDCVFNLGDHASGPLWPKESIQYLMQQSWTHILGNHDWQLIYQNPNNHSPSDKFAFQQLTTTELEWLRTLPPTIQIEDQFYLFHGTPSDNNVYLLETVENGRAYLSTPKEIQKRLGETKNPIICCGHSHIPRIINLDKNTLIINPGSVGLPAYDDDLPEYHIIETGSNHARYAVLEFDNDKCLAQIIAVNYNYNRAAQQARRNGRIDLEIPLKTGFFPHNLMNS